MPPAAASLPLRGRSARKRYSTRQPSRVTCQGRPWRSIVVGDAGLEALAEGDHPLERLVGQHLGERRAGCREREHVRSDRAADPADVGLLVGREQRLQPLGDLGREPVRRGRDSGADRLADREQVGLEPVRGRVAARARRRACASRR